VLFLTTNRITTFDEAFLSRFSICTLHCRNVKQTDTHYCATGIKYSELDQAGRFSVWRKFFELAGCRVGGPDDEFDTLEEESITLAPEDVQDLAAKPFNGMTRGASSRVHPSKLACRTNYQEPCAHCTGPCIIIVRMRRLLVVVISNPLIEASRSTSIMCCPRAGEVLDRVHEQMNLPTASKHARFCADSRLLAVHLRCRAAYWNICTRWYL
jgi:hypothetical protein